LNEDCRKYAALYNPILNFEETAKQHRLLGRKQVSCLLNLVSCGEVSPGGYFRWFYLTHSRIRANYFKR